MTQKVISDTKPAVGRKKINDDQMPARLPAGTLQRIDAVRYPKEKRSEFLRDAVERELRRRERNKAQASMDDDPA